jgi:glutaredoxin
MPVLEESSSARFDNSPQLADGAAVSAKHIRLFIKPYCAWCHRAMHWLDQRGIKYKVVDVIADEVAYDEMIRLTGQEMTPVIDVGGELLADFGPEELARFWQRLES